MIVDLTPLLRGSRGETIRVAGVCAGEAATAIQRAALTGADDDHGGEPPDRPITHVRTAADGRQVEILVAERVATVLQQGGWLWWGQSVLRVNDGVIQRIVVRGPSLASLDIAREDAIARRLGPAAGHERKMGCRLHHYPDRGLIIAWHGREDASRMSCSVRITGENRASAPRICCRRSSTTGPS